MNNVNELIDSWIDEPKKCNYFNLLHDVNTNDRITNTSSLECLGAWPSVLSLLLQVSSGSLTFDRLSTFSPLPCAKYRVFGLIPAFFLFVS